MIDRLKELAVQAGLRPFVIERHFGSNRSLTDCERKDIYAALRFAVLVRADARKSWVPLDAVEIMGCTCECVDHGNFNMKCAFDFASAIEAALKDKNQ